MARYQGQIAHFKSQCDGLLIPCAICATDNDADPMPLIVEVSPGAVANLESAVQQTEEIVDIAARNSLRCVALRPTGRGPGSVYQNYGAVDVMEAIEHAASLFSVDRQRVTVTGASMGGAATWYLISHFPDRFAGAAPFCGYCDYRLWEKPGGSTFHMHPWEESSWRARSASLLLENLAHTPVWMVHGEWDRSVGGGVPVEHSRQMFKAMKDLEYDVRYTEVPRAGHSCRNAEIWEQVVLWLLLQHRVDSPARISVAAWELRHGRSHWVEIQQFQRYGQRAVASAEHCAQQVVVRTDNVRALCLGPRNCAERVAVELDGQLLGTVDLTHARQFQKSSSGQWEAGIFSLEGEKRLGVSGPIADMFHESIMLVHGTTGSNEETFFNRWVAEHACNYYKQRNGGVHRGGIMGENWVDLPLVADTEIQELDLLANHLLLYGNVWSNSIMRRLDDALPLRFGKSEVILGGQTYQGERVAAFAVFPHPLNAERCVAIHGGCVPDALSWGSHLDMQLLPDYIVYNGGKVLDWGFLGNNWRKQDRI